MSLYKISACPRCGAAIEAFHHTRWDDLHSRADVEPDFCPVCHAPFDPVRVADQEAAAAVEWRPWLRKFGLALAGVAVAAGILFLSGGFLLGQKSYYGILLFMLIPVAALSVAWRRQSRQKRDRMILESAWSAGPSRPLENPAWESVPREGVRAILPSPSERRPKDLPTQPEDSPRRQLPAEELARRVAQAFLEPDGNYSILRQLRILSERTVQWPWMRPADADRRLGTPTGIGADGTRAYASVRGDGRGTLSLLANDGKERVLRFDLKVRRRRV